MGMIHLKLRQKRLVVNYQRVERQTARGQVIKCLTIVDGPTHKAVAIEVERAVSGQGVSRVLDRLAMQRNLPRVTRTYNDQEFRGEAMAAWALEKAVALGLIEPGKPNQNAYVESFNGRLRRPADSAPAPVASFKLEAPRQPLRLHLTSESKSLTLRIGTFLGWPGTARCTGMFVRLAHPVGRARRPG